MARNKIQFQKGLSERQFRASWKHGLTGASAGRPPSKITVDGLAGVGLWSPGETRRRAPCMPRDSGGFRSSNVSRERAGHQPIVTVASRPSRSPPLGQHNDRQHAIRGTYHACLST